MAVSRVLIAAFVFALPLIACQSAPPPPRPQPTLAFLQKPAIIAPAQEIAFKDAYRPPLVAPNVEHNHELRPTHIVRSWMDKRVRSTVAAHGRLTIEVLEASVVQQDLTMDNSLKARLTKRQEESKLVGTLKWRVTYAGLLLQSWSSEGIAESSATILEQSSLNDQDKAYADVVEGLARNFDKRMEEQLAGLRRAQSDAADASGH